jgi:hypothetical protein
MIAKDLEALGRQYDRSRLADLAAALDGYRSVHNCENTIDAMIVNKQARESNKSVTRKNSAKWDFLFMKPDGSLRLALPTDDCRYYYESDKSRRARKRLERIPKSVRAGFDVSPVLA